MENNEKVIDNKEIKELKKEEFKDRLSKYRISQGIYKKAHFAKFLRVSPQLYNMVENGTKKPSKDFIDKLVHYSNKSEVYWLYGIKDTFSHIKETIKDMTNEDLVKIGLGNTDVKTMELLIDALKADLLEIGMNETKIK